MKWLTDFLSGDTDKSSKRLVFLIASAVFFIQHFLLMYFKIEIKNVDLVKSSQEYLFWIILTTAGLIAGEKMNLSFGKKIEPPTP